MADTGSFNPSGSSSSGALSWIPIVGSVIDAVGSLGGAIVGRRANKEAIEGQIASLELQRLTQGDYFTAQEELLTLQAELAALNSTAGTRKIITIMVAVAVVALSSAIIWRVVKAKTK